MASPNTQNRPGNTNPGQISEWVDIERRSPGTEMALARMVMGFERLGYHFIPDSIVTITEIPKPAVLRIYDVMRFVAHAYGYDIDHMRSQGRQGPLAEARLVAMYLARKLTGRSFAAIGAAFCRDHSTVHDNCKSLKRKMAKDEYLHARVYGFEAVLRGVSHA